VAKQRALKFFIRLMLPIFALGGFGAIWGMLNISRNDQFVATAVWSPDHHYRASIVQVYGSIGCGSWTSSMVLVERSSFSVNTGQFVPFCVDGQPSKIALHWQGAQTLSIDCNQCGQNYAYADQNWGRLHFVYDLDRP
jgi:hypothetical protein